VEREEGPLQERHCIHPSGRLHLPHRSHRSSFLPCSGLCLHLTGIKPKLGQRHLPPEPHDLPVHQLHCKVKLGREGKKTPNISKQGTAGHHLTSSQCGPARRVPKAREADTLEGPAGQAHQVTPLTSCSQGQSSQQTHKQGMGASTPPAHASLLPFCSSKTQGVQGTPSWPHPCHAEQDLLIAPSAPQTAPPPQPAAIPSYRPASPSPAGYSECM